MAWNRSVDDGRNGPGNRRAARRKPANAAFMGGLAAILVVGGAICAFFLLREEKIVVPEKTETRPRKTAKAPPAPIRQKKPDAEPETPKERPPQKVGEIRDGKMLLQSGRLHPVKGVFTNKQERAWSSIFPHPSENVIAGLLAARPGEAFVGTPHYNGRFTKNFLESLKTPIVVDDGDPDEIKQLKQAVIEAKQELKAAYDNGADIEEMLQSAREELQRMSRYKQALRSDIYEYTHKTEGITEQDVDDYIAAANKLLESKGIAPLKKSWLTGLKLRMNQHKEDNQ